jgi:MscS family membrane protein
MNRINELLSLQLGIERWMASALAIALITILVNQVAQIALRRLRRLSRATASTWDDALIDSAGGPVLMACWAIGAGYIARVLHREFPYGFLDEVLTLRDVTLILCATWFVVRFCGQVGRNHIQRGSDAGGGVDVTTVMALVKACQLTAVVVACLMAAQTLGFQIGGLLALGGVGGIAVGFAAKDLLANFFGGLTIYLDRPFSVGDWIRSPDKAIEGTVEHISWRHTRIRAFNKNPIYVPNSLFTSIVVENPSRMSHRRISVTIGLRYEDFAQVKPIADAVRAMLSSHPRIDNTQTLIVNFNAFGPSSLDLMVYAFANTTVWTEFQDIKQDVLLKIGDIVAQHGAEIAFPTQTVHLANDGEPQAAAPTGKSSV